jgi:hypothetical protein
MTPQPNAAGDERKDWRVGAGGPIVGTIAV